MSRTFFRLGAALAFLSVAFGAFAAHSLRGIISDSALANFETGARYQMYHALGLFAAAWLASRVSGRLVNWGGGLLLLGVILFSGSLYLLSLTGVTLFGLITPFGGVSFLAGWACLFLAAREL